MVKVSPHGLQRLSPAAAVLQLRLNDERDAAAGRRPDAQAGAGLELDELTLAVRDFQLLEKGVGKAHGALVCASSFACFSFVVVLLAF